MAYFIVQFFSLSLLYWHEFRCSVHQLVFGSSISVKSEKKEQIERKLIMKLKSNWHLVFNAVATIQCSIEIHFFFFCQVYSIFMAISWCCWYMPYWIYIYIYMWMESAGWKEVLLVELRDECICANC